MDRYECRVGSFGIRTKCFLLFAFFLLSSCVNTVEQKVSFDPLEVAFAKIPGKATIAGQAFLTQQGGGVVYAAGREVVLVPRGKYAEERDRIIFAGRKISNGFNLPKGTDQRYLNSNIKTKADGEGRFKFDNVADGRYYIVTAVVWMAGDIRQGGLVKEDVTVSGGKSLNIIMSGT